MRSNKTNKNVAYHKLYYDNEAVIVTFEIENLSFLPPNGDMIIENYFLRFPIKSEWVAVFKSKSTNLSLYSFHISNQSGLI